MALSPLAQTPSPMARKKSLSFDIVVLLIRGPDVRPIITDDGGARKRFRSGRPATARSAPPLAPLGNSHWRPSSAIVLPALARSVDRERRWSPTRTITVRSTSLV